jgi:serine/threonine protein phosphatase PrpC
MKPEGRLEIIGGFASIAGRQPDNQDFGALYLADPGERARMGIVAALADGVGGARGGRVAAETVVRGFIDGYYSQSQTIGIAAAGARVLAALNRWVHQIGRSDEQLTGCATTFTGLVILGRQAHVLHVGDSRAWHFRRGRLSPLTEDHTRAHPDQRHVLTRAIGIEPSVRLDQLVQDLEAHDRLVLTTDGVHGVLSARSIAAVLSGHGSAQSDAEALVEAAHAAGSQDNITVLVIDVTALPSADYDSVATALQHLPIDPAPQVGDEIDGFVLQALISDGRYTRLISARDRANGETIVLKFPKPILLSERGARMSFIREALIGARVDSPFVASAISIAPERQSRLYVAMPLYVGETLEVRLNRSPLSIRAGTEIGARIAKGIAALHRQAIIHRDIKPDNVILLKSGGLKVIDLGVAFLPKVDDFTDNEVPGTASYMAPELFQGAPSSEATDQFALGVTLYRMFTGRYPYGEIEPFTRPKFSTPPPPSRYRPDMPSWLEALILRAIAHDPAARFGDMVELLAALEGGANRAIRKPGSVPLIERNPVMFWKWVAAVLAIALIAALAMR